MPFQDSAFDGLLTTQVIHHATLETIRRTIREMCRVLRPGGILFVTVPYRLDDNINHEEVEPGTYIPASGPEAGVPHHVFSPTELEAELAGFQVIELACRGPVVLAFMGTKEAR